MSCSCQYKLKGQKLAEDGRTVFVGGLSWDLDSKGLKDFAQRVGEAAMICGDPDLEMLINC